jgi:hypothetical protein
VNRVIHHRRITLETVLGALCGLPQALTVLEALCGQIFLVTLVARLVTLWVRQSESAG